MKVGDLVQHFLDEAYGVIIRIDEIESYDYPYLVQWFDDGSSDWFGTDVLEDVNEGR
jgi:hypothetical protein